MDAIFDHGPMSDIKDAANHAKAERLADIEFPVTIRDVSQKKSDREWNFVHETTLKMRWPQNSQFFLPWREWREMCGPIVERWMLLGNVKVADAGSGVILGYVIGMGERTVCALYVKAAFRGRGIGLKLLEASNLELPYWAYSPTVSWRRWTQKMGIKWEKEIHGYQRDAAIGGR